MVLKSVMKKEIGCRIVRKFHLCPVSNILSTKLTIIYIPVERDLE